MTERSVKVYLKGDISDYNRAMLEAEAANKGFSKSLDSSNDRMSNLVQTSLALGPALVPISAAAVPAIAGLANQIGIGVAAVGIGVLAFKGLGKALDAVNAASLEPTAANIEKMNLQMAQLGPAGQDFILFLQRARPELQHLQELSREGLFPGVEQGLKSLSGLLPETEHLITTISTTLGDLIAEAGDNLDSPKWREFIAFLDRDARPTLLEMGRTAGHFAEGLANLWMAFEPLETNFSEGFLGLSRDFAKWTDGLDKTEGFQEFLAYVSEEGPEVFDTLGSLANALLQIVEAAAPVGTVMLPVIKDIADAIAALADSDLGPLVIGIVSVTAAFARLKALGRAGNAGVIGDLLGKTSYAGTLAQAKALPSAILQYDAAAGRAQAKVGQLAVNTGRLGESMRGTAKLAGLAGGLAFVMSGLDEKMGLTNTTTLALAGSLVGPWGAALGAGIGLVKDFAASGDDATEKIKSLTTQIQASGINDLGKQRDAVNLADLLVTDPKSAAEADKANAAYDRNAEAAKDAAFAEAGLKAQMDGASQSSRDETFALLQNIATKNQAADATENAFAAETNYRQALKDAAKQARTNNAGIEGDSDAVLKNRTALDQLATSWNRVADSGTATKKQMVNARADFIKVAESMGVAHDAAVALADSILHQPNGKSDIDVDDKGSKKVSDLQARINRMHGKTVTINTRYTYTDAGNAARDAASVRTHRGNAVGGYITGPGTTTSDDIPAWLSNKEYVIKASSVEKYGKAMFDSLNAGTFAGGGLVQRFAAGGSGNSYGDDLFRALAGSGGLDERGLERVLMRVVDRLPDRTPGNDSRTLKTRIRQGVR